MSFPYQLRFKTVIRIQSDWDLHKLEDAIRDWLEIDRYLVYAVPSTHEAVCIQPTEFGRMKRNTSPDGRLLIVDMAMMPDLQQHNEHLWATIRRVMNVQCPACGAQY